MVLGQTQVYRERGQSVGSESQNPIPAWFPLLASGCSQASSICFGVLKGHPRRPSDGLAILNEGRSLRWACVGLCGKSAISPHPAPQLYKSQSSLIALLPNHTFSLQYQARVLTIKFFSKQLAMISKGGQSSPLL